MTIMLYFEAKYPENYSTWLKKWLHDILFWLGNIFSKLNARGSIKWVDITLNMENMEGARTGGGEGGGCTEASGKPSKEPTANSVLKVHSILGEKEGQPSQCKVEAIIL